MKLDRALQKELLERLAEAYPEQLEFPESVDGEGVSSVTVNLWYLDQHGLIEAIKAEYIGDPTCIHAAAITHKGLDFLADDGGLSAILNTLTVKLHADTLRELIVARVNASDLPPADKKKIIDHLRGLPAEALKQVTERLVGSALDRMPDAIPWLQTALDSLQQ